MDIYLLPGLGADKRMYQKQLAVMPGARVLEHLSPVKGQTLAAYAKRVGALIDTSRPFVLIGTSLGGMVCMELARLINPQKIILIASIKNRAEMPLFIRSMKYLNFHRLIPGNAYKRFNNLMVKRLDGRGDKAAAQLIKDMTDDADPHFLKWAINAVINWKGEEQAAKNIVHLHGTADQLFSYNLIKNAIPVKNGTHVMNITNSEEVNRILLKALEE
jgi:pimeloyl-ACP methyl ester carboxylesterase